MGHSAVLTGLGACLPVREISNHDLARTLDTSDEWIRTRTGITARRWVDPPTSTGDLALGAAEAALRSAHDGNSTPPPDTVLLATTTPDRRCPATAPEVASRLGLTGAAAFDLGAVCSGFVYALATAAGLISAGISSTVLVIGAETYSTIIDRTDRGTAVIFGDGAGAALLRAGEPGEPGALLAFDLGSDGAHGDFIAIGAGGSRHPHPQGAGELPLRAHFLDVRGPEVYAHAVRRMTASAQHVLDLLHWAPDAVTFTAHQANQRILDAVADRLGIAADRRVSNIARVGNTAGASIPLALADAATLPGSPLTPGARLLLTAFGGGLTWGSCALTWPAITPVMTTCTSTPTPTSTQDKAKTVSDNSERNNHE
ncbi:beta-ketoacyl-ACP synthase III [Kitasatospora mediocidica]|uniref:beta-ketoacyl-ACP synthase III n=1 Tax=Kitasatospora mediocidica TaxID=58352 RepID=UPI0007C87081|nr:beta-ketoacyl-ACP synthase III [Kitasatospora mediocidica]